MTLRRPDPSGPRSELDAAARSTLWGTMPAAFATELGALATIAAGALVGIVVGIVAVLALTGLLRRVVPGPSVIRTAFLIGGPPLRYGSVIVAAWSEWILRGGGPAPAIAAALVLLLFIPLVGGVLNAAEARARRS